MRSKKTTNHRQVILAAVVALSAVGLATVNGATRLAQSWDAETLSFYEDHDAVYGPLPLHDAAAEPSSRTADDAVVTDNGNALRVAELEGQITRLVKTKELVGKKIVRTRANAEKFARKLATTQDEERKEALRKRVAQYAGKLEDLEQDSRDLDDEIADLREEMDILSTDDL